MESEKDFFKSEPGTATQELTAEDLLEMQRKLDRLKEALRRKRDRLEYLRRSDEYQGDEAASLRVEVEELQDRIAGLDFIKE